MSGFHRDVAAGVKSSTLRLPTSALAKKLFGQDKAAQVLQELQDKTANDPHYRGIMSSEIPAKNVTLYCKNPPKGIRCALDFPITRVSYNTQQISALHESWDRTSTWQASKNRKSLSASPHQGLLEIHWENRLQ